MTASITSHTELAHRVGDGIDVYLFWNESTNDVSIGLVDARTGESFEFEVDGSHALDAFNHPYAYAGHGGTTAGGVRRHRLAVSTDEGHARELTINGGAIMHARIDNPAVVVPGALKALQALGASVLKSDVPRTTLYLVELRASQINGCSICVDIHSHELKLAGEPAERINAVAAWRETPYFTDAERAALAVTEAATRLADRPDPVPDDVWEEAARHYDEAQLAGARRCDRDDQRVQPHQRHDPADHRRLGPPVGRAEPEGGAGGMTRR